jgi:hypothetical protein
MLRHTAYQLSLHKCSLILNFLTKVFSMAITVNGQTVSSVPRTRQLTAAATQLQLGELGFSEILPRLFALGWSGMIYSAANQAATAVSAALATAYTGLGVYNPVGSGVNLVPLKVKYAVSVAPAAIATVGLLASFAATGGVTAQTTKLTVQNGIIGNTVSGAGIALAAATITTPTWVEHLEDGFTAAALAAPVPPFYMDGHLAVGPGGFLGVGALTAITGLGSIFWAELPV